MQHPALYNAGCCKFEEVNFMKQKVLFPLILFLIILVSYGCQSTPAEKVVISKSDEKLEKIIQSAPEESEQVIKASDWNETYKLPNLICDIDAQIILPETN